MPRGGRRPGAGRPIGRIHDSEFRRRVGERCDELWKSAALQKLDELNRTAIPETRKVWKRGKDIPPKQRRSWLKTEEGQEYSEDVEFAYREDHKISPGMDKIGDMEYAVPDADEPISRIRTVTVRRLPKGKRAELIQRVSDEFAIKTSTVARYWKEYRRTQRS